VEGGCLEDKREDGRIILGPWRYGLAEEWDMVYRNDSGSCPMVSSGIISIEPSGYQTGG